MEDTCTGSTESNVSREIEQARNAITNLEESISSLAERLKPVTLPQEKTEKDSQAPQPDRQRCQVDEAFHQIARKIEMQTDRIRKITIELEL